MPNLWKLSHTYFRYKTSRSRGSHSAINPGMESVQYSTAVRSKEIHPIPSLSMHEYLCSLARTPTPKRFDRRRQILLEGRPMLNRVRRILPHASRINLVEAQSIQHDKDPTSLVTRTKSPLDAGHRQRPLNNDSGSQALKLVIPMINCPLYNPVADGGREKAFEETYEVIDENNIGLCHDSNQASITPMTYSPPLKNQEHKVRAGDNSLFVNTDPSDGSEESDEIKTTNLRSSHEVKAPLESLDLSDFRAIQGPFTDLKRNVRHREHLSIENFRLDEREHLFVQSQKNPILRSTRKLRRIDRRQLQTYGNGNLPEHPQFVRGTLMPRRLTVDELDLIPDQFPSTLIQHLIVETTESDDDPIQSFSSSPFGGSKRAGTGHNTASFVKKRKSLNRLRDNIFQLDANDLSKYKLPKANRMSPNTCKRLKISMACSDGFEGRESRPTGRTMPIRRPRRHPRITKQTFAQVPKLSLTSSRSITENMENLLGIEELPLHSEAIIMIYHQEKEVMADASNPLMGKASGLVEEEEKIHGMGETSNVSDLAKLPLQVERDISYGEEAEIVQAIPGADRLKHRATFSKDSRIKALQTLTMVSAPMLIAIPCDSDESEVGETDDDDDDDDDEDDDDDRTGSDLSDQNGSDEEAGDDSDGHYDGEDENSNADIDTEGEEAPWSSSSSLKATCHRFGCKEETFQENLQDDKADNNEKAAFRDKLVPWKSVCNDDTNKRNYSPVSSYEQSPTEQAKASIIEDGLQRQTVTEDSLWRPRKPLSSRRLIELGDDTLDYSDSPREEIEPLNTGVVCKPEPRSSDDHHRYKIRVSSLYMNNIQKVKQSQTSIETEDQNWLAPYDSDEEESYSQVQNPDTPVKDRRRYALAEYPTYLGLALHSFCNPSQGTFSLVRKKSMPSNHMLDYTDGSVTEGGPCCGPNRDKSDVQVYSNPTEAFAMASAEHGFKSTDQEVEH